MRRPGGPILTAAEMRAAEDAAIAAGTSVQELMERAGAAIAEAVWRFGAGRPALILCGPGNNGGDGYVAARLLHERGLEVRVAAVGTPGTVAAMAARKGWEGAIDTLDDAAPAPVLVDALFGTGLSRPLDAAIAGPLARLGETARFTLAVDVPSGVGTDDGGDLGAIDATVTLALGGLKPAHVLYPAASRCGIVQVADIGVPVDGVVRTVMRPEWPVPGPDAHKFRRGMVAILAGAMRGAAMLSARAAMRCAGYVAAAGLDESGPDALVRRDWATIASDDRVGALLVGPGLGRDAGAAAKLGQALGTVHPLVLDADALMLLTHAQRQSLRKRATPVIMTPHAREFERLFGKSGASKIERTRTAAAESGAILVFKGADTVIAAPDGRVRIASGAPGWLASAGTGDVLAGLAAGCLAGGLSPLDAASAAVWLQAEAARLAGPGLIADDLPNHIPAALARCL